MRKTVAIPHQATERAGDDRYRSSPADCGRRGFRWTAVGPLPPVNRLPTCSSTALLDARGQFLHDVEGLAVFLQQARDLVDAVEHRGVVAAAELGADLWQRRIGQFAAQVHGDAAQVRDRDVEQLGGRALDLLDRERACCPLWKQIA